MGFAWAAGVTLPLHAALVIVLGVWTVYVGDRLLDARANLRSPAENTLRERHYFHWRHRRVLVPLASAAGAATAILVLACIPFVARERDSVLAAASLAYFARVHQGHLSPARRSHPFLQGLITKELLVGLLFALGCALPALGSAFTADLPARWALPGAVAFFAALAWLNCSAIDFWESEFPGRGRWLPGIAFLLSAIGFAVALLLGSFAPRPALLLASGALGAMFIALLHRSRARLSPLTLRAAADLVLLTPAIVILVAGPVAGSIR